MPMRVPALLGRCAIAAQLDIACVLFGREYLDLREVGLEVRITHLRLKQADLPERGAQALRRDGPGGEQPFELALLVDECAAGRTRFCGHGGKERLGLSALLGCQMKFGRELEHVGGTCESIELCGLGQAHAFARQQRTDLLGREGLDVTRFLSSSLCPAGSAPAIEVIMSTLRVIPKPEWRSYFDRVSKVLLGKRAEIEVATLDLGDQIVAEWLPMLGITYDSQDDLLDVALDRTSHLIRRPREIVVEESETGLKSVAIVDADGARQIVNLKDPLMLPPSEVHR